MNGPTILRIEVEIRDVAALGPAETSAAMARIVLSGILDRLPEMKIITHHLGAMIPYFENGVGPLWDRLGTRTSDNYSGILAA
jgi:aminocarboxymuconate-semialdehyde decarboxylase